MRKIYFALALLLIAPNFAQAKSLEDLLVEKGVITSNEAKAMSEDGAKVYWNKGTRLDFPDTGFTALIGTQLQTRYQYTDADDDIEEEDDASSFSVRRARLWVTGTALNNEFDYKLQADFVGSSDDGTKTPDLRDAYLAWHACDNSYLKMGQFKTFMSRQSYTSSTSLQFPDRTVAAEAFDLGRDIGVEGGIDLMDGALSLAGQFTNGEGRNTASENTDHAYHVGARYSIMGDANSFSETDVEWHDEAGWDIGAAYAAVADVDGVSDADYQGAAVDTTFKLLGFSASGEFFWGEQDITGGGSGEGTGGYVQAGYFLMPKKFEVAARWGIMDCDNGAFAGAPGENFSKSECSGADDVNEAGLSLNYYWWAHHLKAQLAYTLINRDLAADAGDNDTNKWIFQISSWF